MPWQKLQSKMVLCLTDISFVSFNSSILVCMVKCSAPALCWENRDHAIRQGKGEGSGVRPGQTMHGVIKSDISKTYHEVNTSWCAWGRGKVWQDVDLELHTSEVTAYHSLLSQTA